MRTARDLRALCVQNVGHVRHENVGHVRHEDVGYVRIEDVGDVRHEIVGQVRRENVGHVRRENVGHRVTRKMWRFFVSNNDFLIFYAEIALSTNQSWKFRTTYFFIRIKSKNPTRDI